MAETKTEHEVVTLERRYWQALKDKDVETALALTDNPCIVVGARGINRIDHTTYAAMMQDESWEIVDFSIDDEVQLLMAGDTVMVAYIAHEQLLTDGETVSFDAAESSTWVQRDGRWVCALHTETILGAA
jgi:ketosteroid isomerase-like protein